MAIQGPFKSLVNKWRFKDISDNRCEVEFFIEFQFNSFLLGKMLGGIFEKATQKMMIAFEDRAKDIF